MAELRDREVLEVVIGIGAVFALIPSGKFKHVAVSYRLNEFMSINLATLTLLRRLFLWLRLMGIVVSICIGICR